MQGIKFERISKYADSDLPLPHRSTAGSAGYDFVVAEDTILPPYERSVGQIRDYVMSKNPNNDFWGFTDPLTLDRMAEITKELRAKPTLVPTGIRCKMPEDVYLELSVRSSTPLKHWVVMANSKGVIDSDYYLNPSNEGHVFFQLINLAPFAIQLKKGDKIGQGIFHHYLVTEDDEARGERVGGMGSTGP